MIVELKENLPSKNYNLSLEQFLLLYLYHKKVNIIEETQVLKDKGLLEVAEDVLVVTNSSMKKDFSKTIINDDKPYVRADEEFIEVAMEMIKLYPEGKKPGTAYYWRDSKAVIAKKLKQLCRTQDFQFTKEEAIEATRRYVESFSGNYVYMQLLKYFISKHKGGELQSDFMSGIENLDDGDYTTKEYADLV